MKAVYRIVEQNSSDIKYAIEEKEENLVEGHNVLVEVKACALCSINNKIILEVFHKHPQLHFPSALEIAGNVQEVGQDVTYLKQGDRVAGLLPLDSGQAGCSQLCVVSEYDVVKIDNSVDYVTAAACLGPGLQSYTALHCLAPLSTGDTVLICNGASPFGIICTQLAQLWGAKVIVAVSNPEERGRVEKLQRPIDHVIDVSRNNKILLSSVMKETGGLGVDVLLDNGVRLYSNDDDSSTVGESTALTSKHQLISCLGVGGRWITAHPELQLDPPNCQQLFLRGASVSFLFDQTWSMAPSRHGKLQHILRDIFKKVANGQLGPVPFDRIDFSKAVDSMQELSGFSPRTQTVVEMT